MIEAAGVFDAWGANAVGGVVGGMVGAAFVILGVHYDHKITVRRRDQDERRSAAAQLMIELSNARDAVCGRRQGLGGTAELWRMRNALFTTHVPLHPYPTYHEVYGFYETAVEWRDWVRKKLATLGDAALEDRYPVVNEYREVLRAYGDEVIELLQEHLEDSSLAYERPELPQLPG